MKSFITWGVPHMMYLFMMVAQSVIKGFITWGMFHIVNLLGVSVITVGIGGQRRRLSIYIKMAPLCENGRGLGTAAS